MSEAEEGNAAGGCLLVILLLVLASLAYGAVARFQHIETRLDAIEKALSPKEAPK